MMLLYAFLTAFISGGEGPHLNESGSSSLCLRPVGAGGRDGTNDSSPEVLPKPGFLQVPTQIPFIVLWQGDFKVSVGCGGS